MEAIASTSVNFKSVLTVIFAIFAFRGEVTDSSCAISVLLKSTQPRLGSACRLLKSEAVRHPSEASPSLLRLEQKSDTPFGLPRA